MTYANRTRVSVDDTQLEIKRVLARYGANRFAYFSEPDRAAVLFEVDDRRIRFTVPLADGAGAKAEQSRKQRWRALLLCIKGKLESVSTGIETFEEAFLAHVVMPDGGTVYEHTAQRLAQIARTGEMLPLLPGPQR